jgi:hypothetical protein
MMPAQAQLDRLLATWLALEDTIAQAQEQLLATRRLADAELLARLLNACTDDLRRLSAPPGASAQASPLRRAL